MSRRTRHLTGEEARLWEGVARTAKPLPGKALPSKALPSKALPEPVRPASRPTPGAGPVAGTGAAPAAKMTVPVPPRPASAGLARREARALARGRAAPEGRIDLHGMTQGEAQAALSRFLHRSHASGRTLVMVVTGKGRSLGRSLGRSSLLPDSVAERGILRRMVPHWLALPDLGRMVVGFEEAGPRQGGAGALYVRLRRSGRPSGPG